MRQNRPSQGKIFLEFHVLGTSQKVSAIDEATGIEVSVTGPASASREHISNIAVQKLQRKIEKSGSH